MESRESYMNEALAMARDAFSHEEVPVGCVIVSPEGRILARERNRCRERQDATAHAELLAIQQGDDRVRRFFHCFYYFGIEYEFSFFICLGIKSGKFYHFYIPLPAGGTWPPP